MVDLRTITLDAAFVMKAALTAGGHRTRADRRITDTTDAVILAAACLRHDAAIEALAANRRQSEAKAALGWIRERFGSPRAAMPQRVAGHFGSEPAATWAVEVALALSRAIEPRR